MGKFDRYYEVRDTITDILFSDLVGQVEKDEISDCISGMTRKENGL